MKTLIKFLFFNLLLLLFSACSTREKQEREADMLIQHIQNLITTNAYNAAKIEIDSLHKSFPRLVAKRKVAAALYDTIVWRESYRSRRYCDSLLPIKIHQQDSLLKNFVFEKDDKYQEIGNYVFKAQRTEQNATRTYLKAYVDENAVLYLQSNYMGSVIAHTRVRISVGDTFLESDSVPVSDGSNHSFFNDGAHYESVTFNNDSKSGLSAFVTQHSNLSIKVTLSGSRKYVYSLSSEDKKAISQTYHLWLIKSDIAKLKKEITRTTIRMEKINVLRGLNQ